MKGVIPKCLGELVEKKFGKDKWEAILKEAGLSEKTIFMAVENIDDADVLKVVGATCNQLNITLQQAADAFGEYWVCEFSPKMYAAYYKNKKSAKEMLLAMDEIHQKTTLNMKDAKPPRFEYEWKDDKTLIMHYKSARGMVDFLVGLIKGVGKYFKENLKVNKLSETQVEVIFK
ncbi:MAG: heme NO-binding domain-containing protein [Candidatus Omnitrophota bacterium]